MRRRPTRSLRTVISVLVGIALTAASAAQPAVAREARALPPVTHPASLVNPLIGTAGGVNTFPGPDTPFGMIQWSPDTAPNRPYGGGYSDTAREISGFSLTHLSGPGCNAFGDVPVLPTVGAIGSSPSSATETFSHSAETAMAGYYAVRLGDGVGVRLTDATRAGIAQFRFPATSRANLLLKLAGSEEPDAVTTAQVVGNDEITGSVTSGHFCKPTSWERDYTLHFDMVFDQPFTASGSWATSPISGVGTRQGPGGEYVTFDTTANQTITAKVGISFTSAANAALNLEAEIPGWNFGHVEHANQAAWNAMLGKIQVGGGTQAQQVQFYTALYHALLYPSVFSDVNAQYTGFDGAVHRVPPRHAEYANYSGWDIYRSQVQLAALVAPRQTSDSITSMLNDYAQTGQLPKWSLADGETYAQVGDPADAIIADAYAFGARDFNVSKALADMIHEATVPNDVRPGLTLLRKDGYLPYDGSYGCCNFYGAVSTQLEYDTDDYAIASLARATGRQADYREFAALAQSWQNVFKAGAGYVQARLSAGRWLPHFSAATLSGFVEGTSAQYTPMVPFNIKGLIDARGGDAAWVSYLDKLLSNITSPGPQNAEPGNEPSLEIPYEYDYAGAPYRTQHVVREIEDDLYSDTPAGEPGNDDLGTLSAAYVWDELGFYPETPGTGVLALASPVFPEAVVHLPSGARLTINAPAAQDSAPYVQGLTVNGQPWNQAYVNYAALAGGGTLHYDLAATPDTTWASSPAGAPPSDPGRRAARANPSRSGQRPDPGARPVRQRVVRGRQAHWPPADRPVERERPRPDQPSRGLGAGQRAHSQPRRRLADRCGALDRDGSNHDLCRERQRRGRLPGHVRLGSSLRYYAHQHHGERQCCRARGDLALLHQHRRHDGRSIRGERSRRLGLYLHGQCPGDGRPAAGCVRHSPEASATPGRMPPGQLASIDAAGQTIPVSFPVGATTIGLRGSATDAGSNGTDKPAGRSKLALVTGHHTDENGRAAADRLSGQAESG
ncbi:MAG TPA: GH92 family glycosyl hydrolase, partial [Streptosporangiaceae bacterium]